MAKKRAEKADKLKNEINNPKRMLRQVKTEKKRRIQIIVFFKTEIISNASYGIKKRTATSSRHDDNTKCW